MKKIVGILSLVVFLSLSIAGCGQTSSPSTGSSSQAVWSKTPTQTTAADWKTMTVDQKKNLVDKAISDWKNEGTTVSKDDNYYISGVDNFFNQSGNDSKNVAQAMTAVYIISLGGN